MPFFVLMVYAFWFFDFWDENSLFRRLDIGDVPCSFEFFQDLVFFFFASSSFFSLMHFFDLFADFTNSFFFMLLSHLPMRTVQTVSVVQVLLVLYDCCSSFVDSFGLCRVGCPNRLIKLFEFDYGCFWYVFFLRSFKLYVFCMMFSDFLFVLGCFGLCRSVYLYVGPFSVLYVVCSVVLIDSRCTYVAFSFFQVVRAIQDL